MDKNLSAWLGMEEGLPIDIWNKKYKYENETFEDWLNRVSNGDEAIKELIRAKRFLFGGRILANRGLQNYGKKVTYSNCYVLGIADDSIEAIYQTCADLARTFSYGGGVGIDISPLRAKGMKVNNAAKTTTGAVSFMNTFSNVSEVIGQNGRRGATMISIDCRHPDLEEFINIKNDLNAVTKANISVRITDDFMGAVVNKRDWELIFETENGDVLVKTVKAHEIFRLLAKNNWNMAEPGILFWDRIENYNLLSEDPNFHYAGVNPCAEEPLPNGGSCLLGSFNLVEYYDEFTQTFDFQKFREDIPVVVKAMNDVLDEGLPLHPLQIQRETVRDYRQIGIGMMGLADLLIKLEIRYDSDEAVELCDEIGYVLARESIRASALLAKEYGAFPKCNRERLLRSTFLTRNTDPEVYALVQQYGLRNSQLLTIAPTGTLSTMLGISGGVEPIFSFSYSRRTQSLHGEDVEYKVFTPIAKEYMEKHGLTEEEQLPDFFVTSQTINPFKRVKIQAAWQDHIDASISSTINLPNEATIDLVEDLYIAAWYEGLKGLTIFRDGCDRAAILTTSKPKEEPKQVEQPRQLENLLPQMDQGLKFGDTIMPSDDVIGLKKTIKSGCGTLHLNAYFDEETGELREVFLSKGSKGGCLAFTNAVSRLLSLLARKGAPLEEIVDQLNSVVVCPSYVSARAAGKEVSPGTSCASSIAKALLEMHEKFQKLYMDNDEEYDEEEVQPKKVQINKERITKEVKGPEYATCPECGKKSLMFSGGCNSCTECGWTKCD